jgi:dTDP-4-amino-4,6-dideoxygalactose transaminase
VEPEESFISNHWLTTILIDQSKTGITREELQKDLEKENIEARPLWKPMHMQPVFSYCPAYLNGTSEKILINGLCLPSGSNMSEADRERVIRVVTKCFKSKY